jgi:hypothetical protein
MLAAPGCCPGRHRAANSSLTASGLTGLPSGCLNRLTSRKSLRAVAGQRRRSSMYWSMANTTRMPLLVATLMSVLMMAAAVILGVFGNYIASAYGASIFAGASAAIALAAGWMNVYLARHAAHGSKSAERVLRQTHGGIALELRQIEAEERIALSVINTRSFRTASIHRSG